MNAVILGAGGAVGRSLANELANAGATVRLAARHPRAVLPREIPMGCDLLVPDDVRQAVRGQRVAYLVVGVPYSTKLWRLQWPAIMKNVIDACKQENTALVFLDNVYAYGQVAGWMTESTLFNPCSHKGEVRAAVAQMLLDEMHAGNIQALIARSPDFYGPSVPHALLTTIVYQRLAAGKRPQWIGQPGAKHVFAYVPDMGRALALLGTAADTWQQSWHLPTPPQPTTGEQLIALAAEAYSRPPRFDKVPDLILRLLELGIPALRENREMMYQFTQDYLFDSTKFAQRFPQLVPTPYAEGARHTAAAYPARQ